MAEGNSSRTCAHCAAPIVPRINITTGLPSVRERKFCGQKCLWASKQRKKTEAGYRKRLPAVAVSCGGCGITGIRPAGTNDATRYCSVHCYHHAARTVGAEVAALRRIGARWLASPYTGRVSREAKALRRMAEYVERPRKTRRPCRDCGAPAIGVMEYRRLCPVCKAEAELRARQAVRHSEAGRASRRIHKAKRRAVERGLGAERIDPIKVFERDGWVCYLCGADTPREMRGTYAPNAPELEHVVPLAAGGEHAWANVRCACRRCNSLKGVSLAA